MRRFIAAVGAAALVVSLVAVARAQAAEPRSEQRDVLVQFVRGASEQQRQATLRQHNAKKQREVYGDDVWVISSERGESSSRLATRLDRHPLVRYAEIDHELSIDLANPNDPRFAEQYAHQRIASVGGWTSYPGAYTSTGGPTVAIVDTGIDTDHEDLVGRIDTANSRCFGLLCVLTGYEDDNGHGTHVAGIAAASTNNGRGIAGVAYNTRIMALKVCNAAGTCNTSDVASAINWARDRGAKVVSMSLGGPASSTMQTAVQSAHSRGLVLVAAAGNDGDATLSYPAAYNEVISVAATDANDKRASFSNANADVEIAAPGVSVLSSYLANRYSSLSGTSMAAPHVSGLAALLLGQSPTRTNQQVRDRMNTCADDLGTAGRDPQFGFGRMNLTRALGTC